MIWGWIAYEGISDNGTFLYGFLVYLIYNVSDNSNGRHKPQYVGLLSDQFDHDAWQHVQPVQ